LLSQAATPARQPYRRAPVPRNVVDQDGNVCRVDQRQTGRRQVQQVRGAELAANARDQSDAFGHDNEEAIACFCGD